MDATLKYSFRTYAGFHCTGLNLTKRGSKDDRVYGFPSSMKLSRMRVSRKSWQDFLRLIRRIRYEYSVIFVIYHIESLENQFGSMLDLIKTKIHTGPTEDPKLVKILTEIVENMKSQEAQLQRLDERVQELEGRSNAKATPCCVIS